MGEAARLDSRFRHRVPRIIASSLIMGLALWGLMWGLGDQLLQPGSRTLALGVTVVLGMAIYFGSVILTGGMSLAELRAAVRRQR
jgi:putative peptidoglycan lipid II flippase